MSHDGNKDDRGNSHTQPADDGNNKARGIPIPNKAFESFIEEYRENNRKNYTNERRQFRLECFVALGIAVYTFNAGIFCVAYRQFGISEDTERRQLRAYVVVSETSITVDASNNIHVRMQFKNSGLTPAYKFMGWGCLMISRMNGMTSIEQDRPTLAFDAKTAPQSIIGPGGTKIQFSFMFCDVTPAAYRLVTQAQRDIECWNSRNLRIWRSILCRYIRHCSISKI